MPSPALVMGGRGAGQSQRVAGHRGVDHEAGGGVAGGRYCKERPAVHAVLAEVRLVHAVDRGGEVAGEGVQLRQVGGHVAVAHGQLRAQGAAGQLGVDGALGGVAHLQAHEPGGGVAHGHQRVGALARNHGDTAGDEHAEAALGVGVDRGAQAGGQTARRQLALVAQVAGLLAAGLGHDDGAVQTRDLGDVGVCRRQRLHHGGVRLLLHRREVAGGRAQPHRQGLGARQHVGAQRAVGGAGRERAQRAEEIVQGRGHIGAAVGRQGRLDVLDAAGARLRVAGVTGLRLQLAGEQLVGGALHPHRVQPAQGAGGEHDVLTVVAGGVGVVDVLAGEVGAGLVRAQGVAADGQHVE